MNTTSEETVYYCNEPKLAGWGVPLFSVLIPTYNQAHYLSACLESLLAQGCRNWEAVIVNDGSSDNTHQVLDHYADKDDRFRVFHKENGGVATALNMALEKSRGKWICWLSSDDTFEPNKLEIQVQAFASHPGIYFFRTNYSVFHEETGQLSGIEYPPGFMPPDELQVLQFFELNYVSGISIAVHRSVFEKVGDFNTSLRNGQDFDMWLRISALYRSRYIDTRTCITRVHPGQGSSISADTGIFDSARSCLDFLNQHRFEELFPLLDLTTPEQALLAIQAVLKILINPLAYINCCGFGSALLERMREWLCHSQDQTLTGLFAAPQFATFIANIVASNLPQNLIEAFRDFHENLGTIFEYQSKDAGRLLERHACFLESIPDRADEAALLWNYIAQQNTVIIPTDNKENEDVLLEHALLLDPDNQQLLQKRAERYLEEGAPLAAMQLYSTLLARNANDIKILKPLAELTILYEKYEPSREFTRTRILLNRIIQLYPENHYPQQRFEQLDRFKYDGYVVRNVTEANRTDFPDFIYPSTLSLFLTTKCNLRCFICRRENHVSEDLPFEKLATLEKPIRHATTIDLTGWGECFLYPRFADAIHFIYALNPRKNLIQITSNGTCLSRKIAELLAGRLKSFTISLNAATRKTYNRDMKHGDFDKTIAAIQQFMAALPSHDHKKIVLHFVAHTGNYHEIPQFVALAGTLGISKVSIGNYIVAVPEHKSNSLLSVREEYNASVVNAEQLGKKLGIIVSARHFFSETVTDNNDCTEPFDSCYISTRGDVSPCCYAGEYILGNVFKDGFESVWFSEKYDLLRKSRYLSICQTCPPHISFDDPQAHQSSFLKD